MVVSKISNPSVPRLTTPEGANNPFQLAGHSTPSTTVLKVSTWAESITMISTPRNEIPSHHSRPYVRLAMLSLLLLLSTSCNILNENDNNDWVLDLNQVDGFDVDVCGNGQLEADFFPLQVGTEWTYELVHADADTAHHSFFFPTNFTTSVTGTQTVEGKTYNIVDNYFFPGPFLPAPALMRKECDRVYALIDGEEYLLYSFVEEYAKWSVPLYATYEHQLPRFAAMVDLTEGSAVVSWGLRGFPGTSPMPGDTESGWGDVFNRGLGRVRIVSGSQAYSLTVWDLKEIRTK